MNIDIHTATFHIRTIQSSDKDIFMGLRGETSDVAKAYQLYPGFAEYSWQATLADENEIDMVVFQEKDDAFVAICSFQLSHANHVELGYDVMKEYRGRGIGTKLLGDLTALAHMTFPDKDALVRIRTNNIASQRVAEKCGGKFLKTEPTPEAVAMQRELERYNHRAECEHSTVLTEQDIISMKSIVERGREGVRIYKLP